MEEGVNTPMQNKNHPKEFIFAIVILAVAVAAGYMIYQKANQQKTVAPAINSNQAAISSDPVVQTISTQASTDDMTSIENDINATDFTTLGN